ncbi:MAG: hypothetical protein ABJD13_15955 [Paracoccaceae bacterium]
MRLLYSTVALLALAACSDPLESIEKLSEIDLGTDQTVSALPSKEELAREGIGVAELWNQSDEVDATLPPVVDDQAVGPIADGTKVASLEPSEGSTSDNAPGKSPVSWLARLAAKSESAKASQDATTKQSRSGGQRLGASPQLRDVPFGTVLAFGEVARVCEARSKPLGEKVAQSETRGQVYKIYDTAADASVPRTFYVTGFSDACPRQFTAALALFGDISMHEQLRYGRPSTEYPYSATDDAYENIKSLVCRVGKGKPCGKRLENLARTTVFVSTYEKFTDNGQWADVLLHDGAVVATAMKAP